MLTQPSPSLSLTGSLLAGRYGLRALLGIGGMGEVYEAADLRLDRTVAVKVLRSELTADRRFVQRFHREARVAAGLSHPAIVAVHDFGQDEGRIFLVLEHVPGRTLAQVLREDGPQPPSRVAAIGAEVADALTHTHGRGVVHRDIAPGNVMLRTDGAVKVLDFGIARAARGSGIGGSATAHGTLAYVAPEVLAGEGGDQRVDVYGLGAVLYEQLTGTPPFVGTGEEAIAARLQVDLPAAVRTRVPSIPSALDDLVLSCLARDPRRRRYDAAALAVAFRRLAADAPAMPMAPAPVTIAAAVTTRPVAGAPAHEPNPHTAALPPGIRRATSSTERLPERRRRHPGRALAWVAILTIVAATSAIGFTTYTALTQPVRTTIHGPALLPGPVGLTADASCDGFLSTGVDLTWTPVVGADGYEVWRRGVNGQSWGRVTGLASPTSAVRDADIGVDTSYVYRVRAFDGPLPGWWSAPIDVATPLLCLT